ncbi:MAG: hypothetical protein J7K40_08455 [candidate division Zixibacteria bacterium]|nr:hypothetical protein [candidate division Zixibacteria bacterium]
MQIEGLGPSQQTDQKNKKLNTSPKSENDVQKKAANLDKIELDKTKNLSSQTDYSDKINKEAAQDKNATKQLSGIKQKTSSGFYDIEDTKEKTSDKLINSEGLKNVVRQYHHSNSIDKTADNTSDIRYEKIAGIKKNISIGYYNDQTNFGAFADKIIAYFQI